MTTYPEHKSRISEPGVYLSLEHRVELQSMIAEYLMNDRYHQTRSIQPQYFVDEFVQYLKEGTYRCVDLGEGFGDDYGYIVRVYVQSFCEENGISLYEFQSMIEESSLMDHFNVTTSSRGFIVFLDYHISRPIQAWAEDKYFIGKREYKKQLLSASWSNVKRRIKSSRGRSCERCSSKKNLHIHHKIYKDDCRAWEYEDSNFELLCQSCHTREHKNSK